jgi:hypothetical protein
MTGSDDHDDIGKPVDAALTALRALRKHNANDYEAPSPASRNPLRPAFNNLAPTSREEISLLTA